MRRRNFLKALICSAISWPLIARAQKPTMPVVGFVNAASAQSFTRQLAAFLKGLGDAGYVDGRNVAIEYRWADGRNDRLPAMVAELVRRQVTVIAATTTPAALAAKAATTNIPIVFQTASDPVQVGLVASLNRPGGNVTGVTQLNLQIAPKRLQLLHEVIPAANVIAVLINPANPTLAKTSTDELQAAARDLGLQLHVLNASTEHDFDGAFAKLSQLRASGLVIGTDPFFASRSEQLASLTVRHALPAVYEFRDFVAAGGLMSYGGDIPDSYRLAGLYTARILKGEKPAELPVQQATKVELYMNLRTAKTLGLNVPNALVGRADEVDRKSGV